MNEAGAIIYIYICVYLLGASKPILMNRLLTHLLTPAFPDLDDVGARNQENEEEPQIGLKHR